MTDQPAQIEALASRLSDLEDEIDRHREVLESVLDEPEEFENVDVGAYVEKLGEVLDEGEFLDPVASAFAPLESVLEQTEQEFLADADVVVDGEVIEGGEFLELEPDVESPRARMLVESPLINKLRGGTQKLELSDGRTFTFSVAKTLVADVAEDKTGDLELEMELEEL